jgi:hypothetical protein
VADPSPLSFRDLLLSGGLRCAIPEDFIGDHLRPSDVKDAAKAIDERLQLVGFVFVVYHVSAP